MAHPLAIGWSLCPIHHEGHLLKPSQLTKMSCELLHLLPSKSCQG
jgi:hypothetical protein